MRDAESIVLTAHRNAGGADPGNHADFRLPTADGIRNLQNQGTLHLTAVQDKTSMRRERPTSMGTMTSCAGGACPHFDSMQRMVSRDTIPVMRTGRGIDMVAGYRTAREDTYHLFYGAWMAHGFFGVHRDETWFDHDIERGQTGFASMAASGSRPAGDASYSGNMIAASPTDWEQAAYQGNADLRFHLDSNTLDVEFSNIVSLHNGPPAAGCHGAACR